MAGGRGLVNVPSLPAVRGLCEPGPVTDFTDEDLAGSHFEHVSLAGASFRDVDLSARGSGSWISAAS